jgi:metal-sulfur cluster biosynthetic enzyme
MSERSVVAEGTAVPHEDRTALPSEPPVPWTPAGPASTASRPPATLAERVGGPAVPDDVIEALGYVIDPELGVDIVGLGLVYDARVVDGVARVLLTTTTPACPVGSYLTDAIRWALLSLERIERVEVELTHDPRWTPELMSDEVKVQLGWAR